MRWYGCGCNQLVKMRWCPDRTHRAQEGLKSCPWHIGKKGVDLEEHDKLAFGEGTCPNGTGPAIYDSNLDSECFGNWAEICDLADGNQLATHLQDTCSLLDSA